MLAENNLRDVLARPDLERLDKLLLCLSVAADTPKEVRSIKAMAAAHGLRAVRTWNVSTYLSRSSGKASRVENGWILTAIGRKHIATLGLAVSAVVSHASTALRKHTATIKNQETKNFVDEAISCFEANQYRAAVVLSWVGAVSLLYDHVVTHALSGFNTEATRRNPKHRLANTRDDLARLKETDFLDYLEGGSVIGKSVRKELGVCLDLRNGCGHPNSLKIAEARVASHIETLVLNVYTKF